MRTHLALFAGICLLGCTAEETTTPAPEESAEPAVSSESTPPPAPEPAPPVLEDVDTAAAFELLAENEDVVILDIRTPGEFERGHLAGALNVDYRADDFAEQLGKLDKEATYLVH